MKAPHPKQRLFTESKKKRIIIRAGRRSGKTTGIAIKAARSFLDGRRILYGAPTQEQVAAFWWEVKRALAEPMDAGLYYKNEAMHIIELPGTKQRIKAKTCWNADTLRGDAADLLILDEWQLCDEDAWNLVGQPMLIDNDGDAVFIYTPPSLNSKSVTKARDPRHAAKMFKAAQDSPEWEAIHFTSHDNPHVSLTGLERMATGMTALAYRQEILAEDVEEAEGALWKRQMIEDSRITGYPDLISVMVGVDPPGGATEAGIVVAGKGMCNCKGTEEMHGFVLADLSLQASPDQWARQVLLGYNTYKADRVLGERNYGGDMVKNTIMTAARAAHQEVAYKDVDASRGKRRRAQPVVALYEQGKIHHVGEFPILEDEMCTWIDEESKWSPNRMDGMVWAITELMVKAGGWGAY